MQFACGQLVLFSCLCSSLWDTSAAPSAILIATDNDSSSLESLSGDMEITPPFPPLHRDLNLQILDNLYFNVSLQELSNSFQLFHKIQDFCSSHRSYLPLQQFIATSVIIGCYELLRSVLIAFISDPVTHNIPLSTHILTSVQQHLNYFSFQSHAAGMTRHLFDKSVEERTNPVEFLAWRAEVAFLLPLSCDLSVLSESLASIRQNYAEDVMLWMDIHLFVGMDPLCSYPPSLSEILQSLLPCHQLITISFTTEDTITQKFDLLSMLAYDMGCQFFFTIHPTAILLQPYSLWAGVVRLLHQRLLVNQEGFGYVVYRVSPQICSSFDKQPECQTSVALFGRSHVELFVSNALAKDRTLRTELWSWTHCERQGYNLLSCMLFYCETYLALKSSCYILDGYLSVSPRFSPSPLIPPFNLKYQNDIPMIITRNRLLAASWLSASSPYGFRYTSRSLMYISGYFSNLLKSPDDDHDAYQESYPSAIPNPLARVAYVTALYGVYESSPKPFAKQSIPSDFYCFTDLPERTTSANANGWIIDRTPYHQLISLPYDSPDLLNSLTKNLHPMNVAKFYKAAFYLIPRLQRYEFIVWLDGNVVVSNSSTSEALINSLLTSGQEMILFEHWRDGLLWKEVQAASGQSKYNTTEFAGFSQPRQDVLAQYGSYLTQFQYNESYWKGIQPTRPQYGMWVTCFIGFHMTATSGRIKDFLRLWHEHILRYSTQDQISFSFVSQHLKIHPFSLPDDSGSIEGNSMVNSLFYKVAHGE
jgi:hypothetical protein